MLPADSAASGSDGRAFPATPRRARPGTGSGAAAAAVAVVCAAWCAAALFGTAGAQPLPPDAAHHAGVARNLLAGRGYTVEWIEYHVGLREGVRHVSELHGILRPLVLAPLFRFFGQQDGVVRIPGFAYVALTGLVAFVFARSRFGTLAGVVACALVLGSPALAGWAWAASDDSGFVFFFLCTLWLATESLGTRADGGRPRPGRAALAGGAAGLALLEKQTGLYLPAVLAVVWLLARRRGAGAGFATRLFLPIGAAAGVYALRNLASHGSLAFELGPLSWITKDEGIDGFFRFYESPPSLAGVLARLGPGRIAEIALQQLAAFGAAVFLPWRGVGGSLHLLAFGLPSLLLQLRRDPDFALPALAAALGGIAFLCGLYAMEPRYFLMLIPVSAVSLGGVLAAGLAVAGAGPARRLARGASAAAAAAIVAWSGVFAWQLAHGTALPARDNRRLCPEAVAWLRANTPADAVILTHIPWWLAWVTERPAVAIPSGGVDALARVARHYGASWVYLGPVWGREAAVARAHRLIRGAPELGAELALPGSRCVVYRLTPLLPGTAAG
jgi:4-amino-4-deoxy-L-arabinose transferase-like glycosyltransferase